MAADFNKGKVLSYKEGVQFVSGRLPFENSSSTAAAPSRAHAKGDAMGEGCCWLATTAVEKGVRGTEISEAFCGSNKTQEEILEN